MLIGLIYNMIFEITLVTIVIVAILFFFYRQAVKEFRILQTDSIDKSILLLNERCPIVNYPFPEPINLWSMKDLQQRPLLKNQIQKYLTKESSWLDPLTSHSLANQVGLPIWVQQTILPAFKNLWWGPLLWSQTKVAINAQGLRPTFGYCTIIIATEGVLHVSLLNESSDAYLPKQWLGKRLSKLTRDDAPLLGQIQFVDVIVRPGSALLVPPHWKVCWECEKTPITTKTTKITKTTKTPTLALWIDIHHPVSFISQQVFYRKTV
jgi:hypothetical protein